MGFSSEIRTLKGVDYLWKKDSNLGFSTIVGSLFVFYCPYDFKSHQRGTFNAALLLLY